MHHPDYTLLLLVFTVSICSARLRYSLMEEMDAGTFVGSVRDDSKLAQNLTTYEFSELQFDFLSVGYPYTNLFKIGKSSGMIHTETVIDREVVCEKTMKCDIHLMVGVLTATNTIHKIIQVTVTIKDRNDNFPKFSPNFIKLNIPESAIEGDLFPLPSATDKDSGIFSIQNFALDTVMSTFDIHSTKNNDGTFDLSLIVREKLDHEHADFYKLTVVAKDGGSPPGSGYLKIHVSVIDSNDHSPTFTQEIYEQTYPEDTETGTMLLRVSAADKDAGMNGDVRYSLASNTAADIKQIFSIDRKSGEIQLIGNMDYEKHHQYQFSIDAYDRGIKPQTSRALVIITVKNVNDNKPVINLNMPSEISETAKPGSYIAHMSVRDADVTDMSTLKVRCSIDTPQFTLKKLPKFNNMFQIMLNTSLDREKKDVYDITITCSDGGKPEEMTEVRKFRIRVGDVNDHDPIFTKHVYHKSVKENVILNKSILTVKAKDRDHGLNGDVKYSISKSVDHMFEIDENLGIIMTIGHLDREKEDKYTFNVFAEDLGDEPRSATAYVSIEVQDVNDEPPRFPQHSYVFEIKENSPAETIVGNVTAIDHDLPPNTDKLFWLKVSTEAMQTIPFSIGLEDGVIRTKVEFDHEIEDMYHFTVIASDAKNELLTSSALVSVRIIDVNDNFPILKFPSSSNHTIETYYHYGVGSVIGQIAATDRDSGENGRLRYEIIQGNEQNTFIMDKFSGKIQLGRKLNPKDTNRDYKLVITVSDGGKPTPKTAWSDLKISMLVSNSTLFAGKTANKGKSPGLNLIFIIAIIAGGVLVFIVLIVIATLLITRWRSHRPQPRYYQKAETQKMMSPTHGYTAKNMTHCVNLSDPVNGKPHNMTNSTDANSTKDDSFYAPNNMSHDSAQTTLSTFKTQSPVSSPIDHHTLQYPKACSSMHSVNRVGSPDHNSTLVNDIMTSPKRNGPRYVCQPNSKFLQLKPCHERGPNDTHSSSTGDMTSDSGCGPSEEDAHFHEKNLSKDSTLPRRHGPYTTSPAYQSPRDGHERVTQWMTSQNPSSTSPPPPYTQQQQQQQRENLQNLNSYGGSVANNSPSMSQFVEMDSLGKKRPINHVLPSTYIDYKYPIMESDTSYVKPRNVDPNARNCDTVPKPRSCDKKPPHGPGPHTQGPPQDNVVLRGNNTSKAAARSQRVSFRHPIDDASMMADCIYEDDGETTTSGSYVLSAEDLYDRDMAATLPRGVAC